MRVEEVGIAGDTWIPETLLILGIPIRDAIGPEADDRRVVSPGRSELRFGYQTTRYSSRSSVSSSSVVP
ncbi:hypothetical protein [Halorubrum saccharovorum]|uniref:hypothetical protein n=1 Tax=Halorubrum saccharovorum TaxID=2248 RepID=UPI00126828BD|nr:hypothetical protein [Halorubrum saccharovorum]